MWGLCVLIFGGLYWIIRWAVETGKQEGTQKAYNKKMSQKEEIKKEWISRVTNKELEKEVTLNMRDEERSKEYLPELIDASKELSILDEDFFQNYYVWYPNYLCINNINAIRIVLANRGYLRDADASSGIISHIPEKLTKYPVEYTNEVSKHKDLMLWIDKKLKEHGVDDELCITFGVLDTYHLNDEVCQFDGKYQWAPIVLSDKIKNYEGSFVK